jgi:3-oxoacyl-[acyl-carrier protein] reductase
MGYHGKPSDVAEMVAFLASNAGRYMTGATLVLDGGATTGRRRAQ